MFQTEAKITYYSCKSKVTAVTAIFIRQKLLEIMGNNSCFDDSFRCFNLFYVQIVFLSA